MPQKGPQSRAILDHGRWCVVHRAAVRCRALSVLARYPYSRVHVSIACTHTGTTTTFHLDTAVYARHALHMARQLVVCDECVDNG